MLKSWSIKNFKAIVDSGELQLAPVTIFAGRNSSGKSSLLQSVLMIAQTLGNKADRPLSPNGILIQLGTFNDFINDSSNSQNLHLQFELDCKREDIGQDLIDRYRTSNYKVSVLFSVDKDSALNGRAIESAKIFVEKFLLYSSIMIEQPDYDEENGIGEEKLKAMTFTSNFQFDRISEREQENVVEDIINGNARLMNIVGKQTLFRGKFHIYDQDTHEIKDRSELFFVTWSNFLPTELNEISKNKLENFKNTFSYPFLYIRHDLDIATKQITQFFTSKIRYLGPLRAEPGVIQQKFASSGNFDDVGIKGEHTAVVYQFNRTASIEYYNPITKQVERGIFHHALDNWVSYLGVANQIKTEQAGQEGVSWRIIHKEGQKPRSLAAVGVGVSQILPILVMGLLSPEGSLLIIEQPELHLHPAVQARLGDFFMGLAKCNKQCLIETHSENLVSQLRYHIVQAGGQEQSDCRIYFVDQDEQGAAKFEQVQISPQGNILNWPDGFFDETMLQEDRITAASIKKRAKSAKNVIKNGQ